MATKRGTTQFLFVFVIPMLVVMLVALLLGILGYVKTAWFIGDIGEVLVCLAALGYILFFDSPSRWPGLSARQRLTRVMTFPR